MKQNAGFSVLTLHADYGD